MRPNILIIMADQMRADLRKSMGYPLDTMPYLDSLAEEGINFENAYTAAPACVPARTSMLTGRFPSSHRVRTNHNTNDVLYSEDLVDVLRKNGYRTALCGKNHSYLSAERMDLWKANGHTGDESGQDLTDEERAFDAFLKTLHFDSYLEPAPFTIREELPYRNVTAALGFADSCIAEGRPFFEWVSFAEPHVPLQVPHPYYEKFSPDEIPENRTTLDDIEKKGEPYIWTKETWDKIEGHYAPGKMKRDRANYLGMMNLIDDQIKRLVEGLKERGVWEDTFIFFLSDHGDFAGEYGLERKGPGLSESLARIPFVITGGLDLIKAQGINRKDFVNITDILPTIADLIGAPLPYGCEGKSLLDIVEGKPYPEKDFEVGYTETGFGGLHITKYDSLTPQQEGACKGWKTFDTLNSWTLSGESRMVRKGTWKLVSDMMGRVELYDLSKDPSEINDLADDERYLAKKCEMLTELNSKILRSQDILPTPHNKYRVKRHPKGYWFDSDWRMEEDPGVVSIGTAELCHPKEKDRN